MPWATARPSNADPSADTVNLVGAAKPDRKGKGAAEHSTSSYDPHYLSKKEAEDFSRSSNIQRRGRRRPGGQTPTATLHIRDDPLADAQRMLTIAPSGWNSSKHSSGYYAVPIIIAVSVVLCVLIIVILGVIVAFMRKRQAKEERLKAQDAEAASIDEEKLDLDHHPGGSGPILAGGDCRGSLLEKPPKKRGILRVTKQRITTVRRRRQARTSVSRGPGFSPSESTEDLASPITSEPRPSSVRSHSYGRHSGIHTVNGDDDHLAPQGVASGVARHADAASVVSHASSLSRTRSNTSHHSNVPETCSNSASAYASTSPPGRPPSPTAPADPPAYDLEQHPLTARQAEKRRATAPEESQGSSSADAAAAFYQDESRPLASSQQHHASQEETGDEGSSNAPRPDYDPFMYAGHVATDDKTVLAQRSLLASAPSHSVHSASSVEHSAPAVDVDEDGYERPDHSAVPTSEPSIFTRSAKSKGKSPTSGSNGNPSALPAPPAALRSTFLPSSPVDALFGPDPHEASAPPTDLGLGPDGSGSAEPSAPSGWMPLPMYEAQEGASGSAPPLSHDEVGEEEGHGYEEEAREQSDQDSMSQALEDSRSTRDGASPQRRPGIEV